jgi:hypothetical protein
LDIWRNQSVFYYFRSFRVVHDYGGFCSIVSNESLR